MRVPSGDSPAAMADYAANPDANPSPAWLDHGDEAWQLAAATLVGMQSVPGLVLLYSGLVQKKWSLNSMFMAFYAFAMTLVVWALFAYKLSFGAQWGAFPFLGAPGPVVTMDWLQRQATVPTANITAHITMSALVYYQFVFCAITNILVAGSFLGRMNFAAWALFVPLWTTLSYSVGAFSLWGGGFFYQQGVIDYCGGYVIHLSSGIAGLTGCWWLGPRYQPDRLRFKPNSMSNAMIGAGMLWMGWNGFNGGGAYSASSVAGVAVLNTNLSTSVALLTWILLDVLFYKKPSLIGAIEGMICGLVGITPGAGVVAGWGAIAIGLASGTLPWLSMNLLGRQRWFKHTFDDTLGNFHTHAVAGFVGGLLTGVLATEAGCTAFGCVHVGGAVAGEPAQIARQLVAALFIIALNVVATSAVMAFIRYVCRIPLRMSEPQLMLGDDALFYEEPGNNETIIESGRAEHMSILGQIIDNERKSARVKVRTASKGSGSTPGSAGTGAPGVPKAD